MFQGSANVPKGEHFDSSSRPGGQLNGTTQRRPHQLLRGAPLEPLQLGLWLEADRMKSLDVTQANFENQREAVKEECRMRVDNAALRRRVPQGRHRALRSEDLLRLRARADRLDGTTSTPRSSDDVQAFFTTCTTRRTTRRSPSSATSIPPRRRRSSRSTSATSRAAERPARPVAATRSSTPAQQRETVDRRQGHAARRSSTSTWSREYTNPDHAALELLATILGNGESSRLNRAIAREAKAALATQVGLDVTGPHRGPSVARGARHRESGREPRFAG